MMSPATALALALCRFHGVAELWACEDELESQAPQLHSLSRSPAETYKGHKDVHTIRLTSSTVVPTPPANGEVSLPDYGRA
jgi:hypothetical protein